jgi:hypothetical protein
MPKGPKGQKRPADVIGNAVHVMRIATGEIEEKPVEKSRRAKGGKVGASQTWSRPPRRSRASAAPTRSAGPKFQTEALTLVDVCADPAVFSGRLVICARRSFPAGRRRA